MLVDALFRLICPFGFFRVLRVFMGWEMLIRIIQSCCKNAIRFLRPIVTLFEEERTGQFEHEGQEIQDL